MKSVKKSILGAIYIPCIFQQEPNMVGTTSSEGLGKVGESGGLKKELVGSPK